MSQATFTTIPTGKKLTLNLDELLVHRKLWTGKHSVGYEVSGGGRHFALKVFRSTAGAAFERELRAYQHIMAGPHSEDDCPVVKAYGWIKLPPNFSKNQTTSRTTRQWVTYQLSNDEGAQALIKELVPGGPFDLQRVPPGKMIDHCLALSRLGVQVPSYKRTSFQGGKVIDLSGAEISTKAGDNKEQQLLALKQCVLGCFVVLDADDTVARQWEDFESQALLNPSMPEICMVGADQRSGPSSGED